MRFNVYINIGTKKITFLLLDENELARIIEAYEYGKESIFFRGKKHFINDINEIQIYTHEKGVFDNDDEFYNQANIYNYLSKNLFGDPFVNLKGLAFYGKKVTEKYINDSYGNKKSAINITHNSIDRELAMKITNYKKVKKIFISHSSKDSVLVTSFVNNILQLGIGISDEDIFCASIEGMNIHNGDDFREKIISELNNSIAAILIITNNYKESEVCLNEMGAIWALDIKAFPLINDSLNFETIGFLLKVKQISKLSSDSGLDNFLNSFCEKLVIEPPRIPKWNQNRNKFLQELGNIPIDTPEPIAKKSLQPILKEGAYKFEGKDGLYCPVCFEKNGLTIPLSRSNNGIHHCSNCKGKFK